MTTLSPDQIEMTEVILNDEKLKVVSDNSCTCFINHSKIEYVDIKQALKTHSEIVKYCKENKIKLSYKAKSKVQLQALKNEYNHTYNDYLEIYNTLKIGWQQKLKKGLFVGYGNDKEYMNVLSLLWFDIQKINHSDNVIDRVSTINNRLNSIKENLQYENYLSITL